jgi:two-component system, NtrC family, response regulator HydG
MKRKTEVLVVDDDQRMVKTIYDILKINSYEVVAVNSGEEAVDKIRSDTPDCVLMDIRMKGLNGIETVKIIRETAPHLPVILMSAYVTEEQTLEAKQLGAWAVLDKPIDIPAILSFLSLLRKVRSVLIVDDDPLFGKTLQDNLQARGYKVETEVNPANVLADMSRDYKLAVLLDLKLGITNGIDALRDIRAQYPTKPVILITGYRTEMMESIRKGMQIGAYACLEKPFEIEALIERIDEIDRKKLQAVLGEHVDL